MEGLIAIWQRDIIRYFRDKARLFSAFAMPILFLLLFGSGMSGTMNFMMEGIPGVSDFNYLEFIFPGIVVMTLSTTSIFSSLSVIEDKDFGYMREILVSPISRVQVAIGKVLGGTTVAVLQGLLMFILVPFVGIDISIITIIKLIPVMFLIAFVMSSFGLLIASTLKSSAGFQLIIQMLIMPMIFLSGALFPLNNLPSWMNIVVKINPLTYGVDLMKKIMLDVDSLSPMVREAMGLNLTIFDHQLTAFNDILILGTISIIFVILATVSFNKNH